MSGRERGASGRVRGHVRSGARRRTSSWRPRPARSWASTACCSSWPVTRGRSAAGSWPRRPTGSRWSTIAVDGVEGVEASRDRDRAGRAVGHRRHARGADPAPGASCSWCSAPTPSPTWAPGDGSTRPVTSPPSWSWSGPATSTRSRRAPGGGWSGWRSLASTSRRPTCGSGSGRGARSTASCPPTVVRDDPPAGPLHWIAR